MKRFLKIISTVPCYVNANNEKFFVEKCIYLETDEKDIFFAVNPANSLEYLPVNFLFSDKSRGNKNVRITKYKNNYKIEFILTSLNKIKHFENENYTLDYYNEYILKNKQNNYSIVIKNLTHNYINFKIKALNDNYFALLGYYKMRELHDFSEKNQKTDFCIFNKNMELIHYDTCNIVETDKETFKVYTFLFDQNKQVLIAEFSLKNNEFTKKDFYSCYTNKKPADLKQKYMINQAFFECILANNVNLYSSYLCDELKSKVHDKNVRLMFDNFVKTDTEFLLNTDEVNLITKTDQYTFDAKTYKVEYLGNKISNIYSLE